MCLKSPGIPLKVSSAHICPRTFETYFTSVASFTEMCRNIPSCFKFRGSRAAHRCMLPIQSQSAYNGRIKASFSELGRNVLHDSVCHVRYFQFFAVIGFWPSFQREWIYRVVKKNVPLFENSRSIAARQIGQPMHRKSADFGKYKLNSLNLALFLFLNPVQLTPILNYIMGDWMCEEDSMHPSHKLSQSLVIVDVGSGSGASKGIQVRRDDIGPKLIYGLQGNHTGFDSTVMVKMFGPM